MCNNISSNALDNLNALVDIDGLEGFTDYAKKLATESGLTFKERGDTTYDKIVSWILVNYQSFANPEACISLGKLQEKISFFAAGEVSVDDIEKIRRRIQNDISGNNGEKSEEDDDSSHPSRTEGSSVSVPVSQTPSQTPTSSTDLPNFSADQQWALKMPQSEERVYVVCKIIDDLMNSNRNDEAIKFVAALSVTGMGLNDDLAEYATRLFSESNDEGAQLFVDLMKAQGEDRGDAFLRMVASNLLETNDKEKARRVAGLIKSDAIRKAFSTREARARKQEEVKAKAREEEVKAKERVEAQELVLMMPYSPDKVEASCKIIDDLINSNRNDEAKKFVTALNQSHPDEEFYWFAWKFIIMSKMNIQGVLLFVDFFKNKDDFLKQVVTEMCRNQDYEGATEVVGLMKENLREQMYRQVVKFKKTVEARGAEARKAKEAATKEADKKLYDKKITDYCSHVDEFLKKNKIELARELIVKNELSTEDLYNCAIASLNNVNFNVDAVLLFAENLQGDRKDTVLYTVAVKLLRAGDKQKAKKVAGLITDDERKRKLGSEIAKDEKIIEDEAAPRKAKARVDEEIKAKEAGEAEDAKAKEAGEAEDAKAKETREAEDAKARKVREAEDVDAIERHKNDEISYNNKIIHCCSEVNDHLKKQEIELARAVIAALNKKDLHNCALKSLEESNFSIEGALFFAENMGEGFFKDDIFRNVANLLWQAGEKERARTVAIRITNDDIKETLQIPTTEQASHLDTIDVEVPSSSSDSQEES